MGGQSDRKKNAAWKQSPKVVQIVVAQWLAHLPLVLEVPGSKILVSQHTFSSVICRDDVH